MPYYFDKESNEYPDLAKKMVFSKKKNIIFEELKNFI